MAHRTVTRLVAFSVGLAVAAVAMADTFNLFQPTNGILKGNSSTYVTTAAASSDVVTLFNATSTCTSPTTEFLRADGICAVPAGSGSGSVTSVGISAPASIFSISGSPITGSGTLALSYATGQAATELFGTDGTGNVGLFALTGAYVPPINLASTANGGITGTLGVANGGTGATTLTAHGVLVGEGASAITGLAALAADNVLMGVASADPAGAAVPNCGSGTQALSYSTSTHAFGCQTISAGTGTVTSVALTAPSVFSITGSPVTSTGTLALSFAGAQTANSFLATPNGTSGAVGLRSIVLPDLPPINLASSSNGGVSGNLPVTNLNGGTGASSTTCWYGDGTWKACGTAGAVTSVGLSLPSVFTVSGSPVTSSGTLSATFATGQAANEFLATPDGITGAVGLRSIAASDISALSPTWTGNHTFSATSGTSITIVNNGAASPITTTGVAGRSALMEFAGNGNVTGTSSMAVGQDAVGVNHLLGRNNANLLIGTNGATHITDSTTGTITIAAPSSGPTFKSGNSLATYENSLYTGSAGIINVISSPGSPTAGRIVWGDGSGWNMYLSRYSAGSFTDLVKFSDSGNVTVNAPSSGTGVSISGAANANTLLVSAPNTTGQSFGLGVVSGTNSSDYNFLAENAAGAQIFRIFGDGGVAAGSPTGGDKGIGSLNAQSIYVQNVPVLTTSGNAATASALASTPTQCSGGQFSTGIAASGNANCSTPPSAIQLVSYAFVSSACSLTNPKNASCGSHTVGSGIYNITLSAGFSATPICTANTGHAFVQYVIGSSSSTNASFATYDATGANADEAFTFICVQ